MSDCSSPHTAFHTSYTFLIKTCMTDYIVLMISNIAFEARTYIYVIACLDVGLPHLPTLDCRASVLPLPAVASFEDRTYHNSLNHHIMNPPLCTQTRGVSPWFAGVTGNLVPPEIRYPRAEFPRIFSIPPGICAPPPRPG